MACRRSAPGLSVTAVTVKSLDDWHRRGYISSFPIALAITHEDFARAIAAPSDNLRPFSPRRNREAVMPVFGLGPATRIYLAAGVTDMRKGFEGLYGLVRDRCRARG